jgi:hypothetical protein
MYICAATTILYLLSAVLASDTSDPSPSSTISDAAPSFAQVDPKGAGLVYNPPGGPIAIAWPGGREPSWAPKPKPRGHEALKTEDILKSINKPAYSPSSPDESTAPSPQENADVSQNREFKHSDSGHHHFSHHLSKPAGITWIFESIEHSCSQQLVALLIVVLVLLLVFRLAKRKAWRRVLPRALRGGLEEHKIRLRADDVA